MREAHNNICRATRRNFFAEDKIRNVLEGLRGDDGIAQYPAKRGLPAYMNLGGASVIQKLRYALLARN